MPSACAYVCTFVIPFSVAGPAAMAQPAGTLSAPFASKPDAVHGTISSPSHGGLGRLTRNTPAQGQTTGAGTSGVEKQPDTWDRTQTHTGERPSGSC